MNFGARAKVIHMMETKKEEHFGILYLYILFACDKMQDGLHPLTTQGNKGF
jgi:hypothetical protein